MATVLDADAMAHRRGRHVLLNAEPTAILWLNTTAAVTLGDGSVQWLSAESEAAVSVHAGAILSACHHPDGSSIVTGGDDGRVCRVTPMGEVAEIGRFDRNWVEHLAASSVSGVIVAGVGREAVVWTMGATAPSHHYPVASTIGGIALDGKGKRLGIAHYNGATLVYCTNPDSGRLALNWVGSHLSCTLRPDGRYLVTALQETGLHGWQLPQLRDMRMSGYATKTRSFSWDRKARWLATSGDARAILWPFDGKTGPMGRAPLMVAERKGTIATRVAFHPRDDFLAVGFSDGAVVLARPADDREVLIDAAGGGYVTALAWNDTGTRLGWGGEDGRIGLLDMTARA